MDTNLFLDELEKGSLRSAQLSNNSWEANLEVKENILKAFKEGKLVKEGEFVDKHNLMPQNFSVERGVRLVPGGSSVRRGAYVSSSVVIMPPSYINVGAYVDSGTMIDSHVLVGSCAQIGKNVHLSAGVQIGGVLEPIGQSPVVIEDDCFIGADAIVVEGILVRKSAVLAPGVTLSKAVPLFDLVHEKKLDILDGIPEGAVVISGTRPASTKWAKEMGLSSYCALIVKYRDAKSNASLELEKALR